MKFWKKLDDGQKKILMGTGNKLAPPSRASVRSLGKELIEVLNSVKEYNWDNSL